MSVRADEHATPEAPRAGAGARSPHGGWRRNLRGAHSVWQRELIRFSRERVRVVSSFVQPILYLLVFGTGLAASVRTDAIGGNFRAFLLPGVIAMTCLFTSMFAAVSITWDREFGFLKEILVAPLSRTAVILGKAFGGATTSAGQGLAILVLAPIVGLNPGPLRVLAVAPMLILFSLAVNGLGTIVAARVASMQGMMGVMNFLMLPLFFLSGALFPLYEAPLWLRVLAYLDPASYAVDAIRRTLTPEFPAALSLGGYPLPVAAELAFLAAFAAVTFSIAIRSLARQP